jgi:hypothetical protein
MRLVRRLRCCSLTFGAALLSVGAAQGQERLPFMGDWRGGRGTCKAPYRFTATGYIAPSGFALAYGSIERTQDGFSLKFPDGYRLILSDVKPQQMTWHSLGSGDTFALHRCR